MGTRLYVGNLPFTADETQIRELFAQSGRTVSEVKLVTDRDTGRPRGFGFVEMGSSEDADGAIRDHNGRDFGGRALTVNEAKERTAGILVDISTTSEGGAEVRNRKERLTRASHSCSTAMICASMNRLFRIRPPGED